jgi:hypothetical protein
MSFSITLSGSTVWTPEGVQAQQYMETVLGDTARKLGWSASGGDFDEPVYELNLYWPSAVTVWNNEPRKARAAARVEAWRAAMFYTAHEASFSAGNPGTGQTNRADIHRHAKEMYQMALSEFGEQFPEDSYNTPLIRSSSVAYSGPYEPQLASIISGDEWIG